MEVGESTTWSEDCEVQINFKKKEGISDVKDVKFKARLVTKGFTQ